MLLHALVEPVSLLGRNESERDGARSRKSRSSRSRGDLDPHGNAAAARRQHGGSLPGLLGRLTGREAREARGPAARLGVAPRGRGAADRRAASLRVPRVAPRRRRPASLGIESVVRSLARSLGTRSSATRRRPEHAKARRWLAGDPRPGTPNTNTDSADYVDAGETRVRRGVERSGATPSCPP